MSQALGAVVHQLPGRMRVLVPGLLHNHALAARLEPGLRRIPGMRSVRLNPASGCALVLFDPVLLPAAQLRRILLTGARALAPRFAEREVAATAEPAAAPTPPVSPILPGPGGAEQPPLGLSSADAHRRLLWFGPNQLKAAHRPSFWQRFVEQFKDGMVLTLLGGAALSLVAGRFRDALTITAILVLNAFVGASQAGKAEGSLEALRKMAAPQARALRDGQAVTLPSAGLVPGDILLLEAGDQVPADARIIKAVQLEAEESMLTGESLPAEKHPSCEPLPEKPGVGRTDMLYSGTTITRGRCIAEVTATGMRTEMGRIARLLGETKEVPTPLQGRMDALGKTLVKGALLICAGVGFIGLLQGFTAAEMFMTGVSLAVAAIPEGLPTFVTLGLATGVRQMARRGALVRRLHAVETLGCATVICSDKTGTLTLNQMTARQIFAGGRWFNMTGTGYNPKGEIHRSTQAVRLSDEPDLALLLRAAALCNNAALDQTSQGWQVRGDATEGALLVAAAKAGIVPGEQHRIHPRMDELPFESARRRMSVICHGPDGPCIYTKGAPEEVLAACAHMAMGGKVQPLTAGQRSKILAAASAMADRALRVLAVAYRPHKEGEAPEERLIFLGLVGMIDPPRPEAMPALKRCRQAGIRVVMLTGDHPQTAAAIAREMGLLGPSDLVLTGPEIARMDDWHLRGVVDRIRVCARLSPEQKLRVVRALRARGHVVAMTGDGVNDAPAVKEADIGIAMGRTGTEVTKEAAGLVLSDDNFSTIVAAVEQGRATYNNIRKSVRYLLASNIGELVVMAGAIALGMPLPLVPLQLLWLNLVGDGLPALALGVDPADGPEMLQPPRPRSESVFAGGMGRAIIRQGLRMGAAGLGLFWLALRAGKPLQVVRTMTLCTLVLAQLVYVFRCRRPLAHSARAASRPADAVVPVYQTPPANPTMRWAAAASLALLTGSVYLGPLRGLLQLAPLRAGEWLAAGLAAVIGAG